MSFSTEVKEELAGRIAPARHCRLAELQAIYLAQEGRPCADGIRLKGEHAAADRKFFTILQKAFNIDADCAGGVISLDTGVLDDILRAIGTAGHERGMPADSSVTRNSCCRRAFLRGVFLCAGTVSDPARSYQLEFVLRSEELACMVSAMLQAEGIGAGQTERNGRFVVYIRDGGEIVELLGLMEAQKALLRMENERVVRDVRGNINRRVNLETANIGKAVDAASRQIDAIVWLYDKGYTQELSASLREVAGVRLSHPEATLAELGVMLKPPVGKSGVNHRLRRIAAFAEEKGFHPEHDGSPVG